VHHHIVALAAISGLRRDAHDWVGPQVEAKLLARMQDWREGLVFESEEAVGVGGRPGGEDQEFAWPHLAPQKVTLAITAVGKKRSNQTVRSPEPCTRLFWHQQPSKRLCWHVAQ